MPGWLLNLYHNFIMIEICSSADLCFIDVFPIICLGIHDVFNFIIIIFLLFLFIYYYYYFYLR